MCGIFGYIGRKNSVQMVIKGLKKLEYRGYDSAGISGVKEGRIIFCKEVGKVAVLENEAEKQRLDLDAAIAHTRWATHGRPTRNNAHPQFDTQRTLAVVHNGIIENHRAIREQLQSEGVEFSSETDTEVIAHLVAKNYEGDLLKAVQRSAATLQGAYAFAIIHKDFPQQIVAAAHESPLAIGIGEDEVFVSSDPNAFAEYTRQVIFLTKGESAAVEVGHVQIYNAAMELVDKKPMTLNGEVGKITKEGFSHYTLKEIFDQPQAVRNALLSRFSEEYGTALFEELTFDLEELRAVERILILGCGTSWHAGYIGTYLLEDLARIPAQVEISSEFRYKNPVVPHGTLVIAISQSGETADTIAAVRELKAKGARVLALCNVYDSTLVQEADTTLFLRAGPEIGVCSTKAFSNQLVLLFLFTIFMGRMRNMDKQEGKRLIKALQELPSKIAQVLSLSDHIHALAKTYGHYDNYFFIGRRYLFPASLEGALKLKEIAYINANGYPAGEIKHGPIALINDQCPTVALCANKATQDKLFSNLMEIKARGGRVIAIIKESQVDLVAAIADATIVIPNTIDELSAIPTSVAAQLFAYYIALERGEDIDQPRNLAKSVTVE